MAATLVVDWVLPTTRESKRPIDINDISHVELFVSADGGVNYVHYDNFTTDILHCEIPELEPGNWYVGGTVTDKNGKTGKMLVGNKLIPDDTPPGTLLSLTLSL